MMNTLRKLLILVSVILLSSAAFAQGYSVPEGYVGYYDYDHRVIERKWVLCEDEEQSLWNGCVVRYTDDRFGVYQDDRLIVAADQIYLLPNGNYCIANDDVEQWCVCDKNGQTIFCGDDVETLWNGFYNVKSSGVWHLYNQEGKDTDKESNEQFRLYSNGYFQYMSGGYTRVLNPQLKDINIQGEEITLRNDNSFRVRTGSQFMLYSLTGKKLPNP